MADEYATLSNGNKIPRVGLGTWQSTKAGEIATAVEVALKKGYRLFDTATSECALCCCIAHNT